MMGRRAQGFLAPVASGLTGLETRGGLRGGQVMRWNRILATGAIGVALSQDVVLLWYATVCFIDEQQHPSDMPFGYVVALVFYLVVGSSLLTAGGSSIQLSESAYDTDEK